MRRQSPWWRRGGGYVLLVAFAVIFIGPFVLELVTSFKTQPDSVAHPLALIPSPLNLEYWKQIFGLTSNTSVPIMTWLKNSVIVAVVITIGRVFLDSLAGYALARQNFPGRRIIFAGVLGTLAVPGVVLLIPRFLMLKELGIFDTYLGMTVPIAVDATGIFLMRSYFLSVPATLEEAARIDGAGPFRIYWSVVLPLVKPGLITLTILSFQGSWNEFSYFLVSTLNPSHYTLTLGLAEFTAGSQGATITYPLFMGTALLTTIPVAVMFFIFQKRFTRGALAGGVKE